MKKYLFALCLFILSPRLATAQDGKNPVVPEKVTYSRAIPKGLRAFVPRGGKSRFWGATKLKYNGQQVWVHVYDVGRAKFPGDRERTYGVQKSGFALFTLSKSRHLRRICSMSFEYSRLGGKSDGADFETVGVSTLWLDQRNKKKPIFKIEMQYGRGWEGIIVTLDERFKNGVVQTGFGQLTIAEGTSDTWSTSFDKVDENGFLIITFGTSESDGSRTTTYKWDGKKFAVDSNKYEYRQP